MSGALKAKGIWRQDVCSGIGENIPGKENEYLDANTQKGFYLECLFRLTRRRESLKQLAFFTGWRATALKWFFTEEETRVCTGGQGGWRLCKHRAGPIYPGREAVSVSDTDCRLKSAYSLINKRQMCEQEPVPFKKLGNGSGPTRMKVSRDTRIG